MIIIGGVRVSYAQASRALAVLRSSPGIMVAQALRRAGNPLAACDYHAAAAPYLRDPEPAPAGRGAAGRPRTKQAFMAAIGAALQAAQDAEPARHFAPVLEAARPAFGSDFRYAAEMARAAVAIREREHAAALRKDLAASVHRAVSACDARRGEFCCVAASACGTGDCMFAAGAMRSLTIPAPAGRTPRPANHHRAGEGFGTGLALAALEVEMPFTVAVHVSSADSASAGERAA